MSVCGWSAGLFGEESGSVPTARIYSTQLRQRLSPTQPLQGAVNLGLPAYESSTGNVVFLKDDKTLQVDATAMASHIGPNAESRTTFAYQMATDVLGCWSGKDRAWFLPQPNRLGHAAADLSPSDLAPMAGTTPPARF